MASRFHAPATQAWMVLDDARTSAYARAIAASVRPDDVVLDIGSGTGILALLAAKAGARRVHAVERTAMAELVRAHARENGVEDRLRVHHADFEDLPLGTFPEPPTLIVSELLGHLAPEEHVHRITRLALRHTAPDPRVLPSGYRVYLALARVPSLDDAGRRLLDCFGLRLESLAQQLTSQPAILGVAPDALLGPDVATGPHAVVDPRPERFEVTFVPERAGEANAIVASFEADLSADVVLSTRPGAPPTHWSQVVLPLSPGLACEPGRPVDLRLVPREVARRNTWLWSATSGEERRVVDAMSGVTATSVADLASQLGLRILDEPEPKPNHRLRSFAAILAGGVEGQDLAALTARLQRAMPEEYGDAVNARDAVLELLRLADAL